jgi:hypothetical protein
MAGTGEDKFMNINIHIERLVLDGLTVPYHQQALLQAAVETELTHLFAVNGLANGLMTSSAVSHISAGAIQSSDESNPTYLGQQIARAVYEGISR